MKKIGKGKYRVQLRHKRKEQLPNVGSARVPWPA